MKKVVGYLLICFATAFELVVLVYFVTQSGRASEELGGSANEIGFRVVTIIMFALMTVPVIVLIWIGRRLIRKSVSSQN